MWHQCRVDAALIQAQTPLHVCMYNKHVVSLTCFLPQGHWQRAADYLLQQFEQLQSRQQQQQECAKSMNVNLTATAAHAEQLKQA